MKISCFIFRKNRCIPCFAVERKRKVAWVGAHLTPVKARIIRSPCPLFIKNWCGVHAEHLVLETERVWTCVENKSRKEKKKEERSSMWREREGKSSLGLGDFIEKAKLFFSLSLCVSLTLCSRNVHKDMAPERRKELQELR